jgi:hypothetical protein
VAELTADFGKGVVLLLQRELAPINKKLAEIEERLRILEKRERRFSIFRRKEK